MYYSMVSNMNTEDRKKLDEALASVGNPATPWTRVQIETPQARKPPPWWRGDQSAAQANLAAARSLGFNVMEQV